MIPDQKPRRRWRRYLGRGLLVLALLACVPLGWLAVQMKHASDQQRLVMSIRQAGGQVMYCLDTPRVPDWLQAILGEQFLREVRCVSFDSGGARGDILRDLKRFSRLDTLILPHYTGGLDYLEAFGNLQHLDLSGTKITGADMLCLTRLGSLQRLELNDTQMGDPALVRLGDLQQLRTLGLNGNPITDQGIKYLTALSELRFLSLDRTRITDEGLEQFRKFAGLQTLSLEGTQVTARWVRYLQENMPKTTIAFSSKTLHEPQPKLEGVPQAAAAK